MEKGWKEVEIGGGVWGWFGVGLFVVKAVCTPRLLCK